MTNIPYEYNFKNHKNTFYALLSVILFAFICRVCAATFIQTGKFYSNNIHETYCSVFLGLSYTLGTFVTLWAIIIHILQESDLS